MHPVTDPEGNTARATSEPIDTDELGRACVATARNAVPMISEIPITPRARSVSAAFLHCGRLNAVTAFEIASVPVSADAPEENARRTRNSVTAVVPAGMGFGACAVGHPDRHRTNPPSSSRYIDAMNPYV